MNERIIEFIKTQKVATVCCADEEGLPYCFSCFYAFDEDKHLLIFKSSPGTRHTKLLHEKPIVAGTIQPDKLNPLAVKGVQFTGRVLNADDSICADAYAVYHRKHPYALAIAGEVHTIQLRFVKMTDNALSFGRKLQWQLQETEQI